MTKGMRNKGGGVSNKENNKTMNANNTDNSQRNAKAGGASKSRSKEKQRIVEEEITKSAVPSLDETQANDVSSTAKKEHHKQVQPTSTQIMLAQLMGGENMDSMQKVKIKMVMDITGKMEDAVATALFDASWDESRAVELLLEDGDHLTAWEETGKKGKKKQKQSADDKEETEDLDEYNGQDFRENPGKRGPQRVRRGAGTSQGGDRISSKNRAGDSNGSYEQGRDRDQVAASSGRGRIDQHPRRGGRGGGAISGGRSSYSGRGRRGGGGGIGRDGVGSNGSASANGNENVGGFSGSIDTWNPNGGSSGDGGSCSGGASSSSGGRGGHRSRGGHHGNSKDAFDNAGNWGDDFPAADDWDNEEYTGSLADTKVFTASGQGGKKKQTTPHPKKQSSTVSGNLSSYTSSQVAQANESSLAAGGSSQSVGQQVVPPTPLSTTVGTATSTYSQSIDLSTLLHKPTTQSSVGSNSQQQTLLQFTQQATDSLKAAVGIGQQPTVGTTVAGGSNTGTGSKTGELSYSSYASASAASTSGGSSGNNPASGYGQGNSAFTSIKPSQQQGGASKQQQQQQQGASSGSAVAAAAAHHRSRLPPPSKIPNSAVEMPGDQLGGLDVQFGGLDLQFVGGGASSANSDSVNSFEFNGTGTVSGTAGTGPSTAGKDVENAYLSGDKSKVVTGQSASTSGSVKEVKSLSNTMGTGKLSSNDGYGNNPEGRKSGSGNNPSNATSYSSSRCVDMSVTKQNDSMTGYHGTTQSSYSNYGGHSKSTYHHQTSGYGSNQNNPYSGHHSYGGGNHQGSYGQSYSVSSTGVPSSNYGGNKASSNYPSNDAMVKGNFSNDQSIVNNAAAVLGLTSTTNALTGKVSATTASKVSVPNLPPGVANMLPQHYMAAAGLPAAAAFYGLQQPAAAMYSACTGLEDLAALQRASGLPALQPGYYDPNSQYAATSLAAAAAGNRDGSTNLSSLGSASVLTTSASSGSGGSVSNTGSTNTMSSSHNSIAGVGTNDKSVFGNVSANDSTSSPIPSSTHQQTLQQNAAATPATLNFAATNAFAAQHQQATLPPGYAYFYGQVPGLQAAYGGAGVYPATAMAVPTAAGGTNSTQFQKSAYGTSYGPGYDTLSQQGNKDYSHSYSGGSAVSGKSSGAGGNAGGAGHQYWGNNLW